MGRPGSNCNTPPAGARPAPRHWRSRRGPWAYWPLLRHGPASSREAYAAGGARHWWRPLGRSAAAVHRHRGKLRGAIGGAACEHGGGNQQHHDCGFANRPYAVGSSGPEQIRGHWLISRDQLIALTKTPRGLARRRTTNRYLKMSGIRRRPAAALCLSVSPGARRRPRSERAAPICVTGWRSRERLSAARRGVNPMATAKTKPTIILSPSRDIPFNQLVLSQSNVRRIKAGVSVEELAEDIGRCWCADHCARYTLLTRWG